MHKSSLTVCRLLWDLSEGFLSNKFQVAQYLPRAYSVAELCCALQLSVRPISNEFSEKFLPPPARRCQSDCLQDHNHLQPSRPQPPGLQGKCWPTFISILIQTDKVTPALSSVSAQSPLIFYSEKFKILQTLYCCNSIKRLDCHRIRHDSKELIIYSISKPGAQALIVQFYNCIFLPDWRY